MKKINVGLLFGGISEEYEVSLMSAASVFDAIDQEKYHVFLIGITKEGVWCEVKGDAAHILSQDWVLTPENPKTVFVGNVLDIIQNQIDIAFPVLHGPYGEDGSVQGFFEIMKIPYVGADVISSALCMDKIQTKKVMMTAGLPIVDFVEVFKHNFEDSRGRDELLKRIESKFEYPVFIKPANLGSSVGISKGNTREETVDGIIEALKFDNKVVVEKGIDCREVECAVMGNELPKASGVGEILPSHDFYDYEAKYFDDGKSKMVVPAELNEKMVEAIRNMACEAYFLMGCKGLSRVDFFIDRKTNEIILNEINTMPGFTEFSMYPVLWQEKGISYTALIDELIRYGFEK